MSMGYGANYADVVSDKVVKKFCPKELKALEKALANDEEINDLESLGQYLSWGEEIGDKIDVALNALCKSFQKKTGLILNIAFHDKEEAGDRYDEVNGAFWVVDNVYAKTPEAKKFEKAGNKIQRRFFVKFG